MTGYKATDMNGCCRGFKFEVGKTYTKDTPKEELECCTDKVFHFCRELSAIERESNYKISESRIFEVIAGDFVREGEKYGTNSITILREITGKEKQDIMSGGKKNKGFWNTGYCNIGDENSGSKNIGNKNGGGGNCGFFNTGYCNVGRENSGDCNYGNKNSGNCNCGNGNSGSYNRSSWNSGFFNSKEPNIRMFNKKTKLKRGDIIIPLWCLIQLTVWVSHDTATEKEREEHKEEIRLYGGFLKTLSYEEAWRLAWDKVSVTEHKELLTLPNWDNKVFKEITGIDAEAEIAKEENMNKEKT